MSKANLWSAIGFALFGVLNIILFVVLSLCDVVEFNWFYLLYALGFVVAVWVPVFLEKVFKVKLNLVVILTYQIFLVFSILIGSLWRIYDKWGPYDKIVHSISGVMIALFAYSFLKNSKNVKLNGFWMFVITFSIAMMCGGVWEIWEYVTDGIMGNNAQEYQNMWERMALLDTMTDLICDFCGGIVGATVAIFLEKGKNKNVNNTKEIENVEDNAGKKD